MGPTTFQDWTNLAGLIFTIGGFILVIVQLRQIQSTVHTAAHAAIYEHGEHFRDQLVRYPEFRKYIFEGVAADPELSDIERLRSIAESYLNYLEHLFLSQSGLGEENRRSIDNALRAAMRGAPILHEVLERRTCAFSEPFRHHLDELATEDFEGCN